MDQPSDRRGYFRVEHEDQLFVKVLSSSVEALPPGRTLYCSSEDVSYTGIRIHCESDIPMGSHVELWLKSIQRRGTLIIQGKARWSRALPVGEGYWIGIEFDVEPPHKLKAYQSMIQPLMPGPPPRLD